MKKDQKNNVRHVFIFFRGGEANIMQINKEVLLNSDSKIPVSTYFGSMTFDHKAMRAKLPKEEFTALQDTIKAGKKITAAIAGVVAHGMKEWAMEKGRISSLSRTQGKAVAGTGIQTFSG